MATATVTTPRRVAGVVLTLLVAMILAACGSSYDDVGYVRPAPVVNPTTGERCTAWVNNPHEADGTGLRACDYPIPQSTPVQQPGMSATDFALLMFMYNYGAGHSSFFFAPSYYDNYIGPAWSRYPGTYYGYGRQPVTRVTNYTTVVHNYDTSNASTITKNAANPKYSGYTDTKTGKSYTGKTVPTKSFSGGPSTYTSGGNAGVSGSNSSNTSRSTTGTGTSKSGSGSSGWGSGSGKGGYSGGSSGKSGGSGGGGGGKGK